MCFFSGLVGHTSVDFVADLSLPAEDRDVNNDSSLNPISFSSFTASLSVVSVSSRGAFSDTNSSSMWTSRWLNLFLRAKLFFRQHLAAGLRAWCWFRIILDWFVECPLLLVSHASCPACSLDNSISTVSRHLLSSTGTLTCRLNSLPSLESSLETELNGESAVSS